MNLEHYENLVGVLTSEICAEIFQAGDKLMGLLESYGVNVEYSDGPGELYPGNRYSVTREEGYLEEYEDDAPPQEVTTEREYYVDLDRGVATDTIFPRGHRSDKEWALPPWLLSMIRQHNLFHIRAYYAANSVVDHLGEGETAVKYLDGDEWGYEIFKEGQPVRRLPEGRDRL